MKICIFSEAPSITTGFGITGSHLAGALARKGASVAYLGFGLRGEPIDSSQFDYPIWHAGMLGSFSRRHLMHFLSAESPDLILLNADIATVSLWIEQIRCTSWTGALAAHLVVDALPCYTKLTNALSSLTFIIVPTSATFTFLRSRGVKNVIYAPHGVDLNVFRPTVKREALRSQLGIGDKFLIGVFGRNGFRKQHVRILQALSLLKATDRAANFKAYFHCQPVDSPHLHGWDLFEVVEALELQDTVWFPGAFSARFGLRYCSPEADRPHKMAISTGDWPQPQLGYVDRLCSCDLLINASLCGGFELTTLEANAVGTPLAITNDKSNMAEVAGDAAMLMEPDDISWWEFGGYSYAVSPGVIANTIEYARTDSGRLQDLRQKGFVNAARYPWSVLERAVCAAVAAI